MATKNTKSNSKKSTAKCANGKTCCGILMGVLIAIVFLVCGICIGTLIQSKKDAEDDGAHGFDLLAYDILVERKRYEYEGYDPEMVPVGGYSTGYYYTFVNTLKHEKYTLYYTDIWSIHNQRGDIDTVRITTETISDDEVDNYVANYEKFEELRSVRTTFEEDVKEEYTIIGSPSDMTFQASDADESDETSKTVEE